MLAKRIIPCLDVDKGRVVKGIKFVSLRDAGDPVEAAKAYNDAGADELVFLDITASHEQRPIMPLTVGGGIRTVEDIRALLNAGADKVSINTSAVERPAFINESSDRFGCQCIVVAVDAKRGQGSRVKGQGQGAKPGEGSYGQEVVGSGARVRSDEQKARRMDPAIIP